MTNLPDFSSDSAIQNSEKQQERPSENTMNVVNVDVMKRVQKQGYSPEDEVWYNKFNTWVITGSLLSLFFLLLTLVNTKFIYFVPFWPLLGILAWFFRNTARKHDEKTRRLFKDF